MCGEVAGGCRNEHLLFRCAHEKVVKVKQKIEKAVAECVARKTRPGAVRDAIMVPWKLLGEGELPDVSRVEEVDVVLQQMVGG